MRSETKWMLVFLVSVGIVFSAFWTVQDGKLNLWPLAGMVGIPTVIFLVVSLVRGKKQW